MTKRKINGRVVTQEEWDASPKAGIESGKPPAVGGCRGRSITNFCKRGEVAGERETDKANGVPETEYQRVPGGRECYAPVWDSRQHAADWQKARGLFNRDAGYGDAQPKNA